MKKIINFQSVIFQCSNDNADSEKPEKLTIKTIMSNSNAFFTLYRRTAGLNFDSCNNLSIKMTTTAETCSEVKRLNINK